MRDTSGIKGAVEYLKKVKPEVFSEIQIGKSKNVLLEAIEIDGVPYQQMYDTTTGELVERVATSNEIQ